MELISLHPFDPEVASRYVKVLVAGDAPDESWRAWWDGTAVAALDQAREGSEDAANQISLGLARALSHAHPVFVHQGFGLTTWEARIDRGVGMLMRPPSRLFVDAGLDRQAVQSMPIRLDLQRGLMGGAYVPSRLVGDLYELLDFRLDRMARRLHEAEYDAVAVLGLMFEAVGYARERGLGLYEALDAVGPPIPGMLLIEPDPRRLDRELRDRIEQAIKAQKGPGLLSRLFGRGQSPASNGEWREPLR
jgi:hypothetical protein